VTPSGEELPPTAPTPAVEHDTSARTLASPSPSPSPSPAPSREGTRLVPILLAGGVAVLFGILAFGRNSAPVPDPATGGVTAPRASNEAQSGVQGTKRSPAEPNAHAQNWEQTAEALGVIESQLSRARLAFDGIEDPSTLLPTGMSGEAGKDTEEQGAQNTRTPSTWGERGPPEWMTKRRRKERTTNKPRLRPTGEQAQAPDEDWSVADWDDGRADDHRAAEAPPPEPAVPRFDPQLASRSIWNAWKESWALDLDAAESILVPNEQVGARLRPAHSAVRDLLKACRDVPQEELPDEQQRNSWLASVQAQAKSARETLYEAR
jgi:hypothetical protein